MTTLRKLELGGGVLTALVGLAIAATYFRLDQQALERIGREFPFYKTILGYSMFYILPGVLVLLGSYIHSVKRNRGGQFVLIMGTIVNVVLFLLFFLSPFPVPYGSMVLFSLNFLLPVFSIFTSIISCLVLRKG